MIEVINNASWQAKIAYVKGNGHTRVFPLLYGRLFNKKVLQRTFVFTKNYTKL